MHCVIVPSLFLHWKNAKLLLTAWTTGLDIHKQIQIIPKAASQSVIWRIGTLTNRGENVLM